ncbi:MAG: hypothetical protein ACI4AD_05655 [Roseburia sp.]
MAGNKFKRIRNKQEPVFLAPAFLKDTTGIRIVTESGIFQGGGGEYTKTYALQGLSRDKKKNIYEELRQRDTGYSVTRVVGEEYLIIRYESGELMDAIGWFSDLEEQLRIKGIGMHQRLGLLVKFMAELGAVDGAVMDNINIMETSGWKKAIQSEILKIPDAGLKIGKSIFSVLAVRRIPADLVGKVAFFSYDYMKAYRVSVMPITDTQAADTVLDNYLGMDGILTKIKKKNGILYDCIDRLGESDTRNYTKTVFYFLLEAPDGDMMRVRIKEAVQSARECGIILEEYPLIYTSGLLEIRNVLFSFLLGEGNGCDRYQNMIPSKGMAELLSGEQEEEFHEKYDVEEMRQLFYGTVKDGEE